MQCRLAHVVQPPRLSVPLHNYKGIPCNIFGSLGSSDTANLLYTCVQATAFAAMVHTFPCAAPPASCLVSWLRGCYQTILRQSCPVDYQVVVLHLYPWLTHFYSPLQFPRQDTHTHVGSQHSNVHYHSNRKRGVRSINWLPHLLTCLLVGYHGGWVNWHRIKAGATPASAVRLQGTALKTATTHHHQ